MKPLKEKDAYMRGVYSDYLEAKEGYPTIMDVARKWKISRERVYQIAKEVGDGNEARLKICLENGRFACLWDYRYKLRAYSVGKNNVRLVALVRDMVKDGFSINMISKLTKISRDRINYQLKQKGL